MIIKIFCRCTSRYKFDQTIIKAMLIHAVVKCMINVINKSCLVINVNWRV